MLVYANNLTLNGADAYRGVFSAICGWLKSKSSETTIRPQDLLGSHKLKFGNMWVITETANSIEPHLYSIQITHPDDQVRGRLWVMEYGIRVENNITNFSCVLKIDDMSSLVNSDVIATRPKIIRYVTENTDLVPETIGLNIKNIGDERDSYLGLLYDIERLDRDYPIVLISPNRDGDYPLDLERLKDQLIGLAQIVKISVDFNSYEMEEILGRAYSSWDGSINIIHTSLKNGHIRNKLYKSNFLDEELPNIEERLNFILALITHNTNIPNLRKQIRHDSVRAKSLKDRYFKKINEGISLNTNKEEIESLLELAASQEDQFIKDINRIETDLMMMENERDQLQESLASYNWTITSLRNQLKNSNIQSQNPDTEKVFLASCKIEDPSVLECLDLIETVYSQNIYFLDSARRSAEKSYSFKRGRVLLDMLRKLSTEYLKLYLENGDNLARSVFTNNQYAANESESVTSSAELSAARTFKYKGQNIPMWQHLKVGITDNTDQTIRVHFMVDKIDKKIVIGYCGEHLPLPGR